MNKRNIFHIVVACHTSSATTLPYLQKLFPHTTFIDMLAPTIHEALRLSQNKRIGVWGTQRTIESQIHRKLITKTDQNTTVFEQICTDFVPLLEKRAPHALIKKAVEKYLNPLLKNSIDTLILGCTHYAWLRPHLPTDLFCVGADQTVSRLFSTTGTTKIPVEFFSSGNTKAFKNARAPFVLD